MDRHILWIYYSHRPKQWLRTERLPWKEVIFTPSNGRPWFAVGVQLLNKNRFEKATYRPVEWRKTELTDTYDDSKRKIDGNERRENGRSAVHVLW